MFLEKRGIPLHCRGLYVGGDDVLEPSRNEIIDCDPLARDTDVAVKEIVVRRDARLISRARFKDVRMRLPAFASTDLRHLSHPRDVLSVRPAAVMAIVLNNGRFGL